MDSAFLAREAVAAGLRRRELTRLIEEGRLRRVVPGVLVDAERPEDLALRAEAIALRRPPNTVVVRRSAAWLCGLDVLPPGSSIANQPLEFAVPPDCTPPRWPGCKGYRTPLPAADLTEVAGVVLTTHPRTALDLGRHLPRLHAVAALDAFLHQGLVNPADLSERAAALSGRRNVARLRAVIDIGDAGAQTPGESWTRVRLIDAGLPRPRTQVPVVLPGRELCWLDMGYEDYLVAVEFDGGENHTAEVDRAHDNERRERLKRAGWDFIVVRKGDVLRDDARFPGTTAEALLRRGWRPEPDVLEGLARKLAHFHLSVHRRAGTAVHDHRGARYGRA